MDILKKHLNEVVNKAWNFAGRIDTDEGHEQNAIIGLASESGEILDLAKKRWFHTQSPLDGFRGKLILELGDVLFYFLKVMDVFQISLEEVVAGNRAKLESRHPELGKVETRFGDGYIR